MLITLSYFKELISWSKWFCVWGILSFSHIGLIISRLIYQPLAIPHMESQTDLITSDIRDMDVDAQQGIGIITRLDFLGIIEAILTISYIGFDIRRLNCWLWQFLLRNPRKIWLHLHLKLASRCPRGGWEFFCIWILLQYFRPRL